MKNVKKVISLLMTLVLILAFSTSAFAAEVPSTDCNYETTETVQPRIGYAVHEKVHSTGGTIYYFFKANAIAFPFQQWSIRTTNCDTSTVVEAIIYEVNGPALTDEVSIMGEHYLRNMNLLHNFELGKEYVIQITVYTYPNREIWSTADIEFWIF